jgi:iron(III) transport system substrate-binding protein
VKPALGRAANREVIVVNFISTSWGRRAVNRRLVAFAVALASVWLCIGASPAFAQEKSEWKAKWNALVAAAEKEGKLVISGPVGVVWRGPLLAFQKTFPKISVEYTPFNSRDFWPRVSQERRVGQYLWDLRVGGIDPFAYRMKRQGALDPVRAELIRPDVLDDAVWYGGLSGLFADKEKKFLPGFLLYRYPAGWVNRDMIPASKVATIKDLLRPELAGKIAIQDFRGGAAVSVLSVMIRDYGDDFVTKLMRSQHVIATRNNRQLAEWLIRGRYPIALAVSTDQLTLLQKQGVKMNVAPIEGLDVTVSGFGSVQLLKNRPHPAAAKLYVNWLLTKGTQTAIAKAVRVNSRRKDVPAGNPLTAIPADQVSKFTDSQAEPMLRYQREAVMLGRKVIK